MKKPLISFIVPVYNAEEYLKTCVDSILSQTFKNIELILVNDGSTDNSAEICDSYAQKDTRVKSLHKENGGTHTARNLGIQNSNGLYLAFCDADDWYDLETVEFISKFLLEENLDVLRFNYIREFDGHSVKKENTFLEEKIYNPQDCKKLLRQTVGLVREELSHPENFNFLASVCFGVYKSDIILNNNIEFDNIREILTFEDGLFNIKFLQHTNSFRFLDKEFYHYRKTNISSVTSNYKEDFMQKQMVMHEKLKNYISNIFDAEFELAFNNRLSYSVMEMCNNALKSNFGFIHKYNEIIQILKNEKLKKAYKKFDLTYLPLKWKMYYIFVKKGIVPAVYLMTWVLRCLQKRGK